MDKKEQLLNTPDSEIAKRMGMSIVQSWRMKKSIREGKYLIRQLDQIRALYREFGLRPDEVIDYKG